MVLPRQHFRLSLSSQLRASSYKRIVETLKRAFGNNIENAAVDALSLYPPLEEKVDEFSTSGPPIEERLARSSLAFSKAMATYIADNLNFVTNQVPCLRARVSDSQMGACMTSYESFASSRLTHSPPSRARETLYRSLYLHGRPDSHRWGVFYLLFGGACW